MNKTRLLDVVLVPMPVETRVPSGTMLHVSVAGSPFPVRVPEAVVSHGSADVGSMMNPRAGDAENIAPARIKSER
jgi:hypothetical protein